MESMIEEVKKILEHYFSEELGEGASQDIAEEICQLFEPKPDEGRLLTLKDLLDYHKQKYPHMYKGNDTYWCKEQQDYLTRTFVNHDAKLNREAQDAKTARILTRVPDEGLSLWLHRILSEFYRDSKRNELNIIPNGVLTILTKFKNYVEVDPDQSLPNNPWTNNDSYTTKMQSSYREAQQDLLKDGWVKRKVKE